MSTFMHKCFHFKELNLSCEHCNTLLLVLKNQPQAVCHSDIIRFTSCAYVIVIPLPPIKCIVKYVMLCSNN